MNTRICFVLTLSLLYKFKADIDAEIEIKVLLFESYENDLLHNSGSVVFHNSARAASNESSPTRSCTVSSRANEAISGATAVSLQRYAVLFDGKTLDGWEYDPKVWTIHDGSMHECVE